MSRLSTKQRRARRRNRARPCRPVVHFGDGILFIGGKNLGVVRDIHWLPEPRVLVVPDSLTFTFEVEAALVNVGALRDLSLDVSRPVPTREDESRKRLERAQRFARPRRPR